MALASHAQVIGSRVALVQTSGARWRVAIDGQGFGPAMPRTSANAVKRWLEAGALDELEGAGGSKLERALSSVDHAIDTVGDLLRNGLR